MLTNNPPALIRTFSVFIAVTATLLFQGVTPVYANPYYSRVVDIFLSISECQHVKRDLAPQRPYWKLKCIPDPLQTTSTWWLVYD